VKCPVCKAPATLHDSHEGKDKLGRPMTRNYRKCANKKCGIDVYTVELLAPDYSSEDFVLMLTERLTKNVTES
jgi:hypothetical protein